METTAETSTAGMVWQKSKWIIKGCIVGLMAILFMIPMLYVKNLIIEREERQREVTNEISSKWAGPQNIAGPVLCVPYNEIHITNEGKSITTKYIASFLPDVLTVNSSINPTEKHRGIFKVMLYNTKTKLTGSFGKLALEKLGVGADKFIWNEAFVKLNLTDIKGLNDPIKLKWKDSLIELSPQNTVNAKDGVSALVNAASINDLQDLSFSADIDLNGSEQLLFTPLGKSTTVNINSNWKDPSFNGSILPQATELKDTGFSATWKSMAHTRSFPQQWIDDAFKIDSHVPVLFYSERNDFSRDAVRISGSDTNQASNSTSNATFGVNLFIPVNGYQKTLRTVKYAILCILLTFAAFFLIETVHKKSAHPFQYGLVGLALVLFYTLLLSFSEYTGFNTAYLIASVATIGLIAWFVKGILQSTKPTTVLSVVLVLIYSYVFSILQLQDYALLFGSIGLFLTLAVIMYFSRKISW
ncbi:MAG: cell envelope integrity protein CreD [Bacteroidetes bacterium]|nr:MAG: cell envelope integrity protein CreD [Bacteroidota bacterium]